MTRENDAIAEKLVAGERLSAPEVERLETTADILWLGALADTRRRARHGDQVTFVRLHEIDDAPSADGDDPVIPARAGEVRIVAAPTSTDEALALASRTVSRCACVPVTAYRLDQLAALCNHDLERLSELLGALRETGIAMVAETAEDARLGDWLAVCGTAGLDVARLTVEDEAPENLTRLNDLIGDRDGSAGRIRAFAPLPRAVGARPSTGYTDVRQVALARLLVDNIESVQVDWSRYGPKLAQVALAFGANDIDAVSPLDEHEEGWRRRPLEEIRRNIHATSGVPVERDGRFEKRDP